MNLICGINPVLEALAAGTRHFDRLLVVKGLRNKRLSEAIRRATSLSIPLRFEMRETLDRMAGGVPHQGLIAVVSEKPVLSLEGVLATAREPALVVVLDGVEDPRNLGAILRTAEAAGADGVLLPERHSAGLSETVGRASAGAMEHVRVARVGNLVQALDALKARGIWVVGFDAAGTERWDAVDLSRPVALVLGGEGRGIRRLVREHCDHLVSIPHFGHVGSLNVSVAAGIALYEAVRQRGAVPSLVRPIPARPVVGRADRRPLAGRPGDGPGRAARAARPPRRCRRRRSTGRSPTSRCTRTWRGARVPPSSSPSASSARCGPGTTGAGAGAGRGVRRRRWRRRDASRPLRRARSVPRREPRARSAAAAAVGGREGATTAPPVRGGRPPGDRPPPEGGQGAQGNGPPGGATRAASRVAPAPTTAAGGGAAAGVTDRPGTALASPKRLCYTHRLSLA